MEMSTHGAAVYGNMTGVFVHGIHGAPKKYGIYTWTWIPSIYPLDVSIYIKLGLLKMDP